MATKENCSEYQKCGYVEWRKQEGTGAVPLAKDGDCGIPVDRCQRINNLIPIDLVKYGPLTSRELDVAFPNSRKKL